jgi:hypothetical protein
VSETDSFINEVSEAVRRDKLFRLFRKWGWIPVLLIVLLVGGTAYNEYAKARDAAAAQARGDAILAAMENGDAAARQQALDAISLDGQAQAVVKLLESNEAIAAENRAAAVAALDSVIGNAELPQLYRDLATFKKIVLTANDTAPADRIAALQPLLVAGSAFRVLAEEQVALAEVEMGEVFAALDRLRALTQDTEATAGLRRRVTQLIVALGGEAEPA